MPSDPTYNRRSRAAAKYKRKYDGDKWIIDTSHKLGSVRPIDLVSRDPDRLREFNSGDYGGDY